ncbi:MAG: hypothetical protein HY708_01810, partial [Ignavibacteriae bacterium]|nr:hypothetical protein [Ignavibacteriota bacterium]
MKRIYAMMLSLPGLTLTPAPSQTNSWQSLNGPPGGSVRAFAEHGSYIFSGTTNGVYRSTDQGVTWAHAGFADVRIFAVATQGGEFVFTGTSGHGLFRSSDNGATWEAVNNGLTDSTIHAIFARSASELFVGTAQSGVFRSTNNGEEWTPVNNGISQLSIRSIGVNALGDLLAGPISGGIVYLSTDNGETWSTQNLGLGGSSGGVAAMTLTASGDIVAGLYLYGIRRSTDNGYSWVPTQFPAGTATAQSVVRSPTGALLAATTLGIFRSTNEGESWTQLTTGLVGRWWQSAQAISGNILLVGNSYYAGVFRSTDDGASWSASNSGLINSSVYAIAINTSGHIFAGEHYTGVFRSTDAGQTWVHVYQKNPATSLNNLVISHEGYILAGVSSAGVIRSTNHGETWDTVLVGGGSRLIVNSENHIFAARFGIVYRSTDGGGTWTQFGNVSIMEAHSLLQTSTGAFFVSGRIQSTEPALIFRSTDNGATWTEVLRDSSSYGVRTLAVNAQGHIMAGTWSSNFLSGDILRSTDNGTSWAPSSTGLPPSPVSSLLVKAEGTIYAGTYGEGVYYSTDHGSEWLPFNDGLTTDDIESLSLDAGGFLYAGTSYAGVFRTTQPTTSVHQAETATPTAFALHQNYPNPF